MDPRVRVLAAAILYRATMRAFAGMLASRGMGGPEPEEKMRLHQIVEETAWALPESALEGVAGRDVDEGVDGLPALAAEVERIASDAVAARASAAR